MNTSIFLFLYGLSKYSLVGDASLLLSYAFSYLLIAILLAWAIFYSEHKMFNFSLLFLSLIISFSVTHLLKDVLGVARPFIQLGITPLFNETGFSLPSEHAAVFSALAFAGFFINKKLGLCLGVIAILIGLSRIIIGVHYPLDIIAGFIIGYIVGFLLIKVFKKIQ